MRALVTHPGRQHSHQAALALQEAGMLAGYWSGVPAAGLRRYAPVPLDPRRTRWFPWTPALRRGGPPPPFPPPPPSARPGGPGGGGGGGGAPRAGFRRLRVVRPRGGRGFEREGRGRGDRLRDLRPLDFRGGARGGDRHAARRAVDPPRRPGPPARDHRLPPPPSPDRGG